jgi:hypothetical protein
MSGIDVSRAQEFARSSSAHCGLGGIMGVSWYLGTFALKEIAFG